MFAREGAKILAKMDVLWAVRVHALMAARNLVEEIALLIAAALAVALAVTRVIFCAEIIAGTHARVPVCVVVDKL